MGGSLKKIGGAVLGGLGVGGTNGGILGGIAGTLLKKGKSKSKVGSPTELPDELEVRRRKRRELARKGATSTGRASTILTDDYGSSSLGGG